jgi:hypothetical protein
LTTLEILRAARAKIANPENWTQEAYARDSEGIPCDCLAPGAQKWCLFGAFKAVAPLTPEVQQHETTRLLTAAAHTPFLAKFNDSHTHAEVLAIFDVAISLTGWEVASS